MTTVRYGCAECLFGWLEHLVRVHPERCPECGSGEVFVDGPDRLAGFGVDA